MTKQTAHIDTLPPFKGELSQELADIATIDPNLIKDIDGFINGQAVQGAGVICINPNGEKNLLVYETNKAPYFLYPFDNHAICFGQDDCPLLAVMGIDNAIALFNDRATETGETHIITLPKGMQWQFEKAVNAFGVQYAYTTHNEPLSVACTTVSTIAPLSIALQSDTLDELTSDDNTIVSTQWETPTPLTLAKKRDNPYPITAFGNLQAVVERLAFYAQTPLSMAGQSVLGVLATIGQGKVNAPLSYDYIPTSLYILTEAPSGAGKTSVQNLAYKAVFEYDRQIYDEFIANMKNWNGESDRPINPQLTVDDSTIETILDKFILEDRKNLSWITSESAKFFGGYSMKSDTAGNALGNLTNLYDGGKITRHRKNGQYKTTAYDCRFTMEMSGQREVLKPVLGNSLMRNQGFLPRFMLSCEPSLIGERDWTSERGNAYQDPILLQFWERCDELLRTESPFDDDRYNMPFDTGAKRFLAEYQQTVEVSQRKGRELADFTAFASRMIENTTRIATLLAYFDGMTKLSVHYLAGAIRLVHYSITEWQNYDHDTEPNNAEKLLKWLIKHSYKGEIDKSTVTSNSPIRRQELKEALELLTDCHYIQETKRGRKRIIALNPLIKT